MEGKEEKRRGTRLEETVALLLALRSLLLLPLLSFLNISIFFLWFFSIDMYPLMNHPNKDTLVIFHE